MKIKQKKKYYFLILIFWIFSFSATAQKANLTVLNIDVQGIEYSPKQMGNLLRIEADKLDTFEVMDRYDVAYMIDKHQLNIDNCYGKICLVETGKIIGADKMLSGSVERYGETIIINLRLIDVATETTEKSQVMEFLNLPHEIQNMLKMTLNEMFSRPNDMDLLMRLTKKFNYESSVTNPNATKTNLSGPRMGYTLYTGNTAEIFKAKQDVGGFDAFPAMFQFGYQLEAQYLNEGNFQALFEFIPMITGLDQSMIIPSLTIMNGLRNNKNGFEFAFGPSIAIAKLTDGYYDNQNLWHQEYEWILGEPNPYPIETRLDSRGDHKITSSFVFGIGRTFKSGKLNIPVNAYVIPSKEGFRYGISFGYNAKNKR